MPVVPECVPACPLPAETPEQLVEIVIAAVQAGRDTVQTTIETLSAPVYLTDADGWITHFNHACVEFAGRQPVAGEDRWCVTAHLRTESGEPLDHDACPMALAIRERRTVRGLRAVAERPDGTRVLFAPFPTPLFDEAGAVTGAVNILVDMTDARQAEALRGEARRCRRLAQSITDDRTAKTLSLMASDYEAKANALEPGRWP